MTAFPPRDVNTLLPAPADGDAVWRNPPVFQWPHTGRPGAYRVRLREAAGAALGETTTDGCAVRWPRPLPPGDYFWDVEQGGARRGEWRFHVAPGLPAFVPPTAEALLAALPPLRPRHVYFPEDLPALAAKYAPRLDKLAAMARAATDRPLMDYPDVYRGAAARWDVRRSIDAIRVFLDRDAVACALVWLFRRDEAAGARAQAAFLRACEWNPAGAASVDFLWGDEVGLSLARTLPALYDWLYDRLSPGERQWGAETLAQHARQTFQQLLARDYRHYPGESHAGRLPAYLGEMALVLHGLVPEAESRAWLGLALEVCGTFFPHYGGRDGGWAEGPFYASSYSKWFLPFFFAVERLSGFSFLDQPYCRHAAEFFTHFAAPGMEVHPFGDGHWPTAAEWPGFQAQDPFGVYAARYGSPLARAFAARAEAAAPAYELHLLDRLPPKPRAPLTAAELVGGPLSYVSHDAGLAALHTNLAEPERDLAVFARASRYGTPSHQHADQGAFAILGGGQGLFVPSGTFGYQFGDSHHRVWTQQTVAANCALVNGAGQAKGSAAATAWFEAELERDGVSRLVIHLENAYPLLRVYSRALTFDHRTGRLVVVDELAAAMPFVLDFRLHSYVAPVAEGDGWRVTRERATALARVTADAGPGEFSLGDRYAYPNGAPEAAENPRQRDWRQWHLNWRWEGRAAYRVTAEFALALL